jgi:hypothetical protein
MTIDFSFCENIARYRDSNLTDSNDDNVVVAIVISNLTDSNDDNVVVAIVISPIPHHGNSKQWKKKIRILQIATTTIVVVAIAISPIPHHGNSKQKKWKKKKK